MDKCSTSYIHKAVRVQMASTAIIDIVEELCQDEEHSMEQQNETVQLSGPHARRENQAPGHGRYLRNSVKTAKGMLACLPERLGALKQFLPNLSCCTEASMYGDGGAIGSEGEASDEEHSSELTPRRAVVTMTKEWKEALRLVAKEVRTHSLHMNLAFSDLAFSAFRVYSSGACSYFNLELRLL
jgi:hypothetical protein